MRWAVAALIAATLVVYAASRLLAHPTGLDATYFDGAGWQSARVAAHAIDAPPSTAVLKQRRPTFATTPFSVEWRGFVAAPVAGTYTFRVASDDGSWVYVRGRETIANGGRHAANPVDGRIALDAGLHSIFIRYFQDGGDCAFELSWSRDGRAFEPVPAWALLPERASFARVLAQHAAQVAFTILALATYGAIVVFAIRRAAPFAIGLFTFDDRRSHAALKWVLLVAFLLNVWGLSWGLPNARGWAPDEVVPLDVLHAVDLRFSHGWFEKYPPLQYMVLAAADSPVLLASSLGLVDVSTPRWYVALAIVGRVVSLAFSLAALVVVYRCGLELYGSRGAAFAALITALTVPFAYYSKLANLDVPYLCWFAVSLLAYIRILKYHRRRDYVLFAISAALAGCTKDQAWGLYFATPIAILIARWRDRPHALFDATTWTAIAAGVATFLVADNVVYNFSGFVAHVRLLLDTPAPFREFPRTIAGEAQMAWRTIEEMRYMFGWPLSIVVVIAFARESVRQTRQPSLAWLLVPAISYYLSFVGVILFYFDRYFLPLTIVLALYAGAWLERFLARDVRARRARIALVSAAFAYTAAYVALVDYAMAADSRYVVSRWIRLHAQPDDVVAALGPLEFAMIADDVPSMSVDEFGAVAAFRPAFVVLNADQMPTLPDRVQWMHDALLHGRGGYRLALTAKTRLPPLPGLHPDLGHAPRHGPEFSDLSMINPKIEVFERTGSK